MTPSASQQHGVHLYLEVFVLALQLSTYLSYSNEFLLLVLFSDVCSAYFPDDESETTTALGDGAGFF